MRESALPDDYTQANEIAASGGQLSVPYFQQNNAHHNALDVLGRLASLELTAVLLNIRSTSIGLLFAIALAAPGTLAQTTATIQAAPIELVRAAVNNEIAADRDHSVKHMFRSRKSGPKGSQTRLYAETTQAMAGMTIAYNDQPLSQQQIANEEARLNGLRDNPEQLKKKQAQEKEDAERTMRIVRALPDAFVYEYAGPQENGPTAKLNFRPNPNYEPPSRVEQVLTGMSGFVEIDKASRRLITIDGTLFKDVSFGWGILGHLDKGGHFLVRQAQTSDGSWMMMHMALSFTGKILLFKSISITSDEVFSDFHRVPAETTFAQAIELLKGEQAKLAENGKTEPPAGGARRQ